MSHLSTKVIKLSTACIWLVLLAAGLKGGNLKSANTRMAGQRPNILLIVSEDNGPELGCYGDPQARTPNLDALAAAGTRFEKAFTTYALCSPSRASIYTGLYPHQHGQVGLATHKYHMYEDTRTFPAYLKKSGYRTGVIGKIHVNPESSIPFDWSAIRSDNFKRNNMHDYVKEANHFMGGGPEPFLLMVNFPDAHFPLVRQAGGLPVAPRSGKDMKGTLPFVGASSPRLLEYTADYYNSIERLDALCGQLFDLLRERGADRNTVIIYLGDHGAQFSRGKHSSHEAGLRIPLIIKDPRLEKQRSTVHELVSVIDLLPTILEITGEVLPSGLPGQSLIPTLTDGRLKENRPYIYSASDGGTSMFFHPTRSIRDQQYKLIHHLIPNQENPDFKLYAGHFNSHFDGGTEQQELKDARADIKNAYDRYQHPPEFELFDLQKDPQEWINLSDDRKYERIFRRLKKALLTWRQATADPLAETEVLQAYVKEIEEVNMRYPNHSYQKDNAFRWRFYEAFSRRTAPKDGLTPSANHHSSIHQ
jgi:N-sulfoglucosamine sulfohydrolase